MSQVKHRRTDEEEKAMNTRYGLRGLVKCKFMRVCSTVPSMRIVSKLDGTGFLNTVSETWYEDERLETYQDLCI